MYILTVCDQDVGAYAIQHKHGKRVLYMFEEEDDASRYLSMLDELDYPKMKVTEINPYIAFEACDNLDYHYTIIKPEDIIIPPDYDKVYRT